MAVPVFQPERTTTKIHYIYFVVMCLFCGNSLFHLLKWLCLRACPCAPLQKSTISILWQCAFPVGALLLICRNGCACVPAWAHHYQNPLYLFCGNVPFLWELFISFVEMAVPACLPVCPTAEIHYIYFVALCLYCGSTFVHLLKWLCLRACPCAPLPKSTISILWQCAFSVGAL